MAYDPKSDQFILFGGFGANVHHGDTWSWNGSTWTELHPAASPPARGQASMAYDPDTGQLILFGGADGDITHTMRDTWSWDENTWSPVSTTGPSAREGAAMAYDAATHQLLLFGGLSSAGIVNDTWVWNGTAWVQLSPGASPAVRYNAGMAYDAATSQMLLYGGKGNTDLGDTWNWTGATWSPLSPTTTPGVRFDASMAFEGATGQLLLFGGISSAGGRFGDTWNWNGTTWNQVSTATTPGVRYLASMAFDGASNQLLLVGGYTAGAPAVIHDDTWGYNVKFVTNCSGDATVAGSLPNDVLIAPSGQAIDFEQDCFIPAPARSVLTTAKFGVAAPNLTIDGAGHSVEISGGGQPNSGLYDVRDTVTLTLRNVTLSGTTEFVLSNTYGTVHLQHVRVWSNSSTASAVLLNHGGVLTIDHSAVENNETVHGPINSTDGSITITNSTLTGNVAHKGTAGEAGYGGAVYSLHATVTIANSTFVSNYAQTKGGAIYSEGPLTVTNSTFLENWSDGRGGAINTQNAATVTSSTFYRNSSPAGAAVAMGLTGQLTVGATIFAGSTISPPSLTPATNCVTGGALNTAYITDKGYNLDTDGTCLGGGPGNLTGQDPKFDPNYIQMNGGPTPTIATLDGSPAIDHVPAARCPATDQRGVVRPDDGETFCDVGAYEHTYTFRVAVEVVGNSYALYLEGSNFEVGSTLHWKVHTDSGEVTNSVQVPTAEYRHLIYSGTCNSGRLVVDASGRESKASGAKDITTHFDGNAC